MSSIGMETIVTNLSAFGILARHDAHESTQHDVRQQFRAISRVNDGTRAREGIRACVEIDEAVAALRRRKLQLTDGRCGSSRCYRRNRACVMLGWTSSSESRWLQ